MRVQLFCQPPTVDVYYSYIAVIHCQQPPHVSGGGGSIERPRYVPRVSSESPRKLTPQPISARQFQKAGKQSGSLRQPSAKFRSLPPYTAEK